MSAGHKSTTSHLTDEEIIAAVESCGSKAAAARLLNVTRNAVAWRYANMAKDLAHETQRWVVTSAQNDAELHTGFYNSLLNLCTDLGCRLRVIPFFYQNPSAMHRVNKSSMFYDHRLIAHWCEKTEEIHPSVAILGDLKVSGTAVNPISGLESMTGGEKPDCRAFSDPDAVHCQTDGLSPRMDTQHRRYNPPSLL